MPNYDYDFRVLIDSINGEKKSYGTASFVSADGVQPILSSSQVLDRINSLKEIEYYNSKTYTTSSLDALFASKSLFTFSNTDDGSDYQFLSASIRGNDVSGSILFTGNSTASGSGNDFIKRYKFFGNKVCNVLGIPENYWIYVDKFRFTNTGSEQNYLSGDVLGQSLHLTSNFAISNAGSIESDLPFQHARDTDRWLKWRNVSGSIPHNELQIGYSNKGDRYEIRTSDGENDLTGTGIYGTLPLIISASKLEVADAYGGDGSITASGGIRVNSSAHIAGNSNLTIGGQTTSYTNNTIHQLQFNHSTKPSGINFSSLGGGKIDFLVAVDESPTTLMVLSGSDEGTATLKLTGDISASGDVKGSTLTGTLSTAAQTNITSLGTLSTLTVGHITINGSQISDGGNLTIISTGGDVKIGSDEKQIDLQDGDDNTKFSFKTDNTPEMDVTGNFTIDGTGDITLDSATNNIDLIGNVTASGNIKASGYFYQDNYPAFAARRSGEGSTTTSDTWTRLYFNAEDYDIGNDYNTTTALFTVPTKGIYQFNCGINFRAMPSMVNMGLRLSGSNGGSGNDYGVHYDMNEMYQSDSDSDGHTFTFSKSLQLEAGVQIAVEYMMNNADSGVIFDNAQTVGNDVIEVSWFDGYLVTPLT